MEPGDGAYSSSVGEGFEEAGDLGVVGRNDEDVVEGEGLARTKTKNQKDGGGQRDSRSHTYQQLCRAIRNPER